MKKHLLSLFFFIMVISNMCAQDYQISFTGSGASAVVDSVKVENLTQCTVLDISGSDILHLVAALGIEDRDGKEGQSMFVYPNPTTGLCLINFEATSTGKATIGLYDIAGQRVAQVQELLTKGKHTFCISGLNNGVYTLKVESGTYSYNSQIVSVDALLGNVDIKEAQGDHHSALSDNEAGKAKNGKSLIQMQYNAGDQLKLTGKSGVFRTVFMLVAANSQTVDFNFMLCTDADGNSYAVVEIGAQWWMAENLNSGTYAAITTPQVSGTKFCQDVNGQADPNCPMGGLYEWANLMQGASQCNGTGAPPNDRCATPVKGLCPDGWHVPSHYEWTTLERNAGSNPGAFPYDVTTTSLLGTDEGGNLKETCTSYWWAPNAGATNKTGFSGLPGGDTWNGVFEDFGQSGYFWTSTEPLIFAWVHALNYSLTITGRSSYAVESGFSVRCVKD